LSGLRQDAQTRRREGNFPVGMLEAPKQRDGTWRRVSERGGVTQGRRDIPKLRV
jgi:hypothetical protein